MGLDTQIQHEKSKLLTMGLQTVGGLLMCILGYFTKAAHESVQAHEGRIIRVETQVGNQGEMVKEIREDVKRLLDAVRAKP